LHGDAAARAIERAGGRIRFPVPVDAVETEGGAVTGVRVGEERFPADAVVVAVPHDAAREVLPREMASVTADLEALGTSPIVNVHVVYDRPVMPYPVAAGLHSPVQWVFDRTEAAGVDGGGQCLSVSVSAATAQLGRAPADLVATYTAALADLFPAARDAGVVDAVVTREHAATFRAAPGAQARRLPTRTSVSGLFLAGAWTDTGWPATMEGAVRSGNAAAAEALVSLGRPTSSRATAPGQRAVAGRVSRPVASATMKQVRTS
jgi:uncharacterized protein with NAD-binding domain and iron-sulfur cluster